MTIRSHPGKVTINATRLSVSGPSYNTSSSRTYDVSEVYVGGDNPQWLKAVKAGQNATNPLTAKRSFCDFQPLDMRGTLWQTPNKQLGTSAAGQVGYMPGQEPSMPDPSHSSAALAECVARFNHKLQDQMRPVQGLVFLGELGKTIRMVKQTGRRLTTRVEDYVRKARRYLRSDYRSRKALKGLSDLWLEHAFGWTPLYLDIAAGVKDLLAPRSERVMVRAWGESRSISFQQNAQPIGVDPYGSMQCDRIQRNTTVSSAQQVACLDFSLVGQPSPTQADFFGSVASRWGFTLRGFIPAVWELIPYSFLVDYYTNLGDVIDSAFADRRAIAWGYQTQRTTAINETRWYNCRPNPGYMQIVRITSSTPGYVKVGTKRFDRKISLATIPPIQIGYPDFGGKQYANQIALILGRLRTR